jgi:hypothetical protein
MPILTETVRVGYKLLPLTLYAEGGSSITLRRGLFSADGVWSDLDSKSISIDAETTAVILDTIPTPGLTRRDDLSYAIYTYLVTNGLAPVGEVV